MILDLKTILEIGNDSWPLVMLILMCFVIWKGTSWAKLKVVEPLAVRAAAFLDKAIAATDKNSEALEKQTALLDSINKSEEAQIGALTDLHGAVVSLDEKHKDPNSPFSSVRTNEMVEESLQHNKVFAVAAVRTLKYLAENADDPRLIEAATSAIHTLEQIDKNGQA